MMERLKIRGERGLNKYKGGGGGGPADPKIVQPSVVQPNS